MITLTNQTHLRRSELKMTETELKAMAAAAIQGAKSTPTGTKAPAAIGTPANICIPLLLLHSYVKRLYITGIQMVESVKLC